MKQIISSEKEKFIKNNKFAISEYDIVQKKATTLYNLFKKYQDLSYDEFISKISEEYGEKLTNEDIKKKIKVVMKRISYSKAIEMLNIVNLTIATKNNNQEKIKEYKDKLIKKDYSENNGDTRRKALKENNKVDYVKKLINDINIVINERKNHVDLYEEGKITTKDLFTLAKFNVSFIGVEKFIEFIIASNNLEPINETLIEDKIKDLEKIKNELNQKLQRLEQIDVNDEKNKQLIIDEKVNGEEELANNFKKYTKNVYNWKKRKLKGIISSTSIMQTVLSDISESHRIKTLGVVNVYDLCRISLYDVDSVEIYKKLENMNFIYKKSIDNVHNPKIVNEFEEKFNKRLILKKDE